MIPVNPLLGTLFHAIGAMSAAVCYTPQKATRLIPCLRSLANSEWLSWRVNW